MMTQVCTLHAAWLIEDVSYGVSDLDPGIVSMARSAAPSLTRTSV
ncbi:hypothetical protein [Flexivirga sp. B27]